MSSIASILIEEPSAGPRHSASHSRTPSTGSIVFSAHSHSPSPSPSEGANTAASVADYQLGDSSPEPRPYSPSIVFAAHSRMSSPMSTASSSSAVANRRRKVLTSRPPNSFILYRSDKLRELIQQYPELKQTDISKMCADNWKHECPEVKEYYRVKQQEAKARFLSEQAIEVQRISGGRTDKGAIKRIQPTNTFIRYRTEMKKKLAKQFAAMNQKDVSRACGLMWRSEPEHVKMRYRQSYNQEKRDFERLCITSTMEPSEEACAALASVIAQTSNSAASSTTTTAAGPAPAASRPAPASRASMNGGRSSGGYRSAPVSPPQPAPIYPQSQNLRVNTQRPHSFHASSLSASPMSLSTSSAGISLPSCASLLSMAGTSPAPMEYQEHHAPSGPAPPMQARHASSSTVFTYPMDSTSSSLPMVPSGSFESGDHVSAYRKQPAYAHHNSSHHHHHHHHHPYAAYHSQHQQQQTYFPRRMNSSPYVHESPAMLTEGNVNGNTRRAYY